MPEIIVRPCPAYPAARVDWAGFSWPAVVGKNGVSAGKREGDGKTPLGRFEVLGIYYRADRLSLPAAALTARAIEPDDAWCDDPAHPLYNQPVKANRLGGGVSYERLWRKDHLYDVLLDLGYNRSAPAAGQGSAVFMHVAANESDPPSAPTAGCIALPKTALLQIIDGSPGGLRVTVTKN